MLVNRTPVFNLKAVVHETGLKPDTLRAWERRYGLPEPARTPSGHRLYSQRDIDILKWLIARQQEGMSISRAADLWAQLAADDDDPSSLAVPNSEDRGPLPIPRVAVAPMLSRVDELRERWIDECLRFDERATEQTLHGAFAMFGTETVCLNILQQGLAAIGEGWHEGRVTVQQEHFASGLAIRRLEAMLSSTPAPTRAGRVILGCPPQELHTFVPVMLSLLLRRRGYDVVYLGASIPFDRLEETVQAAQPVLVILTAQRLVTAADLLKMAVLLQAEGIPVAYGGLPFTRFSEINRVIPGYYLGTAIYDSLAVIEEIMAAPELRPADHGISAEYESALRSFQSERVLIESELWQLVVDSTLTYHQIAEANQGLGSNIEAALIFGNIDFLTYEHEYVMSMLTDQMHVSSELLNRYLEAYHQAVNARSQSELRPVARWLDNLLLARRTANHGTNGASKPQ